MLGTCHHDCPDSCGWVVTVEDEPEDPSSGPTAVRLRGNPDHPYSRGELCPKVNRFLDRVYSPDRILRPLVRRGNSGNKGRADFAPASWDEALALVAERLGEIVHRYGGEAVLPWWSAGTQGLIHQSSLDRRFFAKLGASRLTGSLCGAVAGAGTASTNGSGRAADPTDVRFARLVLLWGTNTRLTNRHLWPFVEEARGNGATIVVIDPMRTMTAESADWFVQPLPGTDVALMLGLMHVLIRDDLIDHDYVERHTVGFEHLAEVVREWSPARAAQVCGLRADEVERLGHTYGTTSPTFIRTLIGAEHQEHGAMFFRALACLPALTGAWRHRGGGLARSVGAWAETNVDESVFDEPQLGPPTARRAVNMNHLGRALTDTAMDPRVMALFVWNGNPLVSVPNAELTRRGLVREDLFTVVSEQFLTDTARYADVIFPAATQIEQTDVVASWGHLYLGWNEAAIPPLGEAVPNTELWRRLARAMGFTEPELFEDDESLLRSALRGVDVEALRARGFVRAVAARGPAALRRRRLRHGQRPGRALQRRARRPGPRPAAHLPPAGRRLRRRRPAGRALSAGAHDAQESHTVPQHLVLPPPQARPRRGWSVRRARPRRRRGPRDRRGRHRAGVERPGIPHPHRPGGRPAATGGRGRAFRLVVRSAR